MYAGYLQYCILNRLHHRKFVGELETEVQVQVVRTQKTQQKQKNHTTPPPAHSTAATQSLPNPAQSKTPKKLVGFGKGRFWQLAKGQKGFW